MRSMALLALLSCDAHPNQLVVTFDTDAMVVSASGVDALVTPALFDRLRVDVVPPPNSNVTCNCTNDFAVTSEMFALRQVSIGIPLAGPGWTLRARLYLVRLAVGGEPDADATLDVTVPLPAAADNPGQAAVFLGTDSAGQATTSTLDTNASGASRVSSWPGAANVLCDTSSTAMPQPPDTACVPGGAFWMGSQDGQAVAGRSATWHRLAVLSPYYVDEREVTVKAFRASGLPAVAHDDPASAGSDAFCTFTASPGPYETLPINCVDASTAAQYCASLGGALPTGAQYERLATRFGRGAFVWGADQPDCQASVWARCGTTSDAACGSVPMACVGASHSPFGPATGGSEDVASCDSTLGCRDALQLDATTSVYDLIGNVAELSGDRPFQEDDTCYGDFVLHDPSCPRASPTGGVQLRGGAWSYGSVVFLRGDGVKPFAATDALEVSAAVGFRCVYPAAPLQR